MEFVADVRNRLLAVSCLSAFFHILKQLNMIIIPIFLILFPLLTSFLPPFQPEAVIIPAGGRQFIELIECDQIEDITSVSKWGGLDLSAMNVLKVKRGGRGGNGLFY